MCAVASDMKNRVCQVIVDVGDSLTNYCRTNNGHVCKAILIVDGNLQSVGCWPDRETVVTSS